MTLERPMFPPSRRGFLALSAGAAVVPVVALAAPASPLDGPYSPALVDASLALQGAHESLKVGGAAYDVASARADGMGAATPATQKPEGASEVDQKSRQGE